MTSFIAITFPTILKNLNVKNSKKFLRSIFPKLFNFFLYFTIKYLIPWIRKNIYGLILCLFIALSFLLNIYFLMFQINQKRDLYFKGDNNSSVSLRYLQLASVLLYQ